MTLAVLNSRNLLLSSHAQLQQLTYVIVQDDYEPTGHAGFQKVWNGLLKKQL